MALSAVACGGGQNANPTAPTGTQTPPTSAPPVVSAPTAPTTSTSVAGNYTLSLRNAPTCPAFSREYSVTITQSGSTIAIDGPNTSLYQSTSFYGGRVVGSSFSAYLLAHEIAGLNSSAPGSFLMYAFGQMQGTSSGATISGTLNGEFGRPEGGAASSCTAVNHAFTLRRR